MISHFQVSCNLGDFGDWESDCFCPGQGNWFIFYKTRNQDLTICCSAMKKENHGRKKNKGKRERESQSISLPFSPLSFTFSLLCCKHLEVWSMSQKLWHICAVSWLWEPVGNAYYAHILYILSSISSGYYPHTLFLGELKLDQIGLGKFATWIYPPSHLHEWLWQGRTRWRWRRRDFCYGQQRSPRGPKNDRGCFLTIISNLW